MDLRPRYIELYPGVLHQPFQPVILLSAPAVHLVQRNMFLHKPGYNNRRVNIKLMIKISYCK